MRNVADRLVQSAFVLLTTALLGLAISELRTSIRSVDVSIVAERIEAGRGVSPPLAEEMSKDALQLAKSGYCRSDVVAAGLTMVLFDLDQHSPQHDYDAWLSSAAQARDYLVHALRCMPANSNIWLRMAAVQSTIAEDPQEIASLMAQSARFSPAEETGLLARFNFWNSYTLATLKAATPALSGDIATLLEFGDRCRVNAALAHVGPQLKPYVDDIWSTLGTESTAKFSKRC